MIDKIVAAVNSTVHKVKFLTNDRIDAMASSHGTLNIAAIAFMDVCVEEVLKGADISLTFKNERRIELDDVIEKMLICADKYNVDRANAALLMAAVLYFAGTNPRAGVPAGNRKLGAMCRIAAGVPRGGVSTITSPKFGNKVSGFPAVKALYDELKDSSLTSVKGRNVPFGALGTLYMHSILGEDMVLPEIIEKGAKIAVDAILDAMDGVGMMMCSGMADKITAAMLASAAILELIHPDANVKYEDNYIPSCHAVGKAAAKAAGLPEKLHKKITGDEYDTGILMGDFGLLLKDSGTVSTICMMAITDLFAMFKEWVVWTSGPTMTPIASLGGEAWIAMNILIENQGDVHETAKMIKSSRDDWFDPEISNLGLNIIAQKTFQLQNGIVSETLVLATEAAKIRAVTRRATKAYNMFSKGATIEEVVTAFEIQRKHIVEQRGSEFVSEYFNREIEVEILRAKPLGRIAKKGRGIGRYWALDPDVDVKVIIDGKEFELEKLCELCIPKVALQDYTDSDYKTAVEAASVVVQELSYSGVSLLNVTVPVSVAVVLGNTDIHSLATKASEAAYLTGGIPGAKQKARWVGETAKLLMFEQEANSIESVVEEVANTSEEE